MILAAVNDLMLASRIRAASPVTARLQFARTGDEVVERARALRPSLILLDLNGAGFDSVDTITRLKSDPDLRDIRIVGFVSHVQADLVAAARAAGIDEVLARSAFVARLPELLRP